MSHSLRFSAAVRLYLYETGTDLKTRLDHSLDGLAVDEPFRDAQQLRVELPPRWDENLPDHVVLCHPRKRWSGIIAAARVELDALVPVVAGFVVSMPDSPPNFESYLGPDEHKVVWATAGGRRLIDARRLSLRTHPLELPAVSGPRVELLFGDRGFWEQTHLEQRRVGRNRCDLRMQAGALSAGFPRLADLMERDPRAALDLLPSAALCRWEMRREQAKRDVEAWARIGRRCPRRVARLAAGG